MPACRKSPVFAKDSPATIGFVATDMRDSANLPREATARRLAIMNLAIRSIEADIGKEHADTFRSVQHPDLRADWQISNAEVRMWN